MGGFASPLALMLGMLTRSRGCHTVILYGSRVRGDADPDSDVDVFAVGRDIVDGPLFRSEGGYSFDIWVADEKSVEADLEGHLKIEDGRVLVQRAGYGDELLRRVKARVAEGPLPLTTEEIAQRIHWLERMVARAGRGDDEGRYRLLAVASELPLVRFELAGRYWLGTKRSLKVLSEFDPGFLELYRRVLDSPSIAAIEACVRYLARATPG